MIKQQLYLPNVKPTIKHRLTTFYIFLIYASKFLAQILLMALNFVRFVSWSAILVIFSFPYQIWSVFIPKKNGSLPISRFLRKLFEHQRIKTTIGLGLTIIVILANFLSVQVSAFDKPEEQTVLEVPKEVLLTTQTTFRLPVPGYISSGFSWFHPAIDIAGNDNRLVYAVADGKVIEADYSNWGYGNTIVIDHGSGLITRYAHLQNDIRVKVSDQVTRDTVLGKVGATGWATGLHLHFEVWENGEAINPLLALPDLYKEG